MLYIYSIVGVYAFHDVRPAGAMMLDKKHVNFKSFGAALLTLFRCVTGESWNGTRLEEESGEERKAGDHRGGEGRERQSVRLG